MSKIVPSKLRIVTGLALLGLGWLLSGCASTNYSLADLHRSYRPENIHCPAELLPATIRRIAVLPLAGAAEAATIRGCATLTPVVYEELCKSKRFEASQISPATLLRLSGRPSWGGGEPLPAEFFDTLREVAGCDAVLFQELTVFRPFTPVAVGWRFKLVDARTREILWATDEVFDAAQPRVAAGARRFELAFPWLEQDNWSDTHSPSRMGRYSAATLLATLPGR
jgi:hypothetical protein